MDVGEYKKRQLRRDRRRRRTVKEGVFSVDADDAVAVERRHSAARTRDTSLAQIAPAGATNELTKVL